MACKWLNSNGEVITTRSCREFAERFGMSVGVARQLHSGQRSRIRGFCSMARRARKQRQRFMTRLVNLKTGESAILGQSVKRFAADRGLSLQGLSELVNGRVPVYRYWVLGNAAEVLGEPQ